MSKCLIFYYCLIIILIVLVSSIAINPLAEIEEEEGGGGGGEREAIECENGSDILIRLALFIDLPLSLHLKYNLRLDDEQIQDFVEVYVGQLNAIFLSLKSKTISRINLSLTESFFETKEKNFTGINDGNVDLLLSNFCLYQAEESSSSSSIKWDLAILLTATDLYSEEEARHTSKEFSLAMLGISPVNGIDWPDLSCLVVEFGVGYESKQLKDSNDFRVYPTRGFGSVWVAAHELAHNLGIHHDGQPFNTQCNDGKFIMSQNTYISKGMNTKWSKCSSDSLDHLDLISRFSTSHIESHQTSQNEISSSLTMNRLPGQVFDAKSQCSFYSKLLISVDRYIDNNSSSSNNNNNNSDHQSWLCNEDTLWCVSTIDGELVPIGPALEGTTKC